jgi:serine/threonine protein kinase
MCLYTRTPACMHTLPQALQHKKIDISEEELPKRVCTCMHSYIHIPTCIHTLLQVLQHKKIDMSEEEMASFAKSSLEAIGFLHDLGRVHRDIKVTPTYTHIRIYMYT